MKIFSGVQPSGNLHLGNYLGALKQWVALQGEIATASPRDDKGENDRDDNDVSLREANATKQSDLSLIFCIVDLHAITVANPSADGPKVLHEKILEVAALYIACGIDPEKSTIFVQSDRPEHSELAWILNCHTYMGELNRMTQFKEKAEGKDKYSVGLFDYPALMAADILLYQTTHVPVGEDQKQHIEITRDLAQRLNNKYVNQNPTPGVGFGDDKIFTVPEAMIPKETARIMGLDDPTKKMSKSAPSPANYIALTDDDETIRSKIKKAVTDSGNEIKADPSTSLPRQGSGQVGAGKPAITNLLNIFAGVTGKSVAQIEQEFAGKSYGEFKDALGEAVIAELAPVRKKFEEIISDKENLKRTLKEGAVKVAPIAQETLKKVKGAIGLGI